MPAKREALPIIEQRRRVGQIYALCSSRRRTSFYDLVERRRLLPCGQAGQEYAYARRLDLVSVQHPTQPVRSVHGAAI